MEPDWEGLVNDLRRSACERGIPAEAQQHLRDCAADLQMDYCRPPGSGGRAFALVLFGAIIAVVGWLLVSGLIKVLDWLC